ncbi:ATP-dependent DNA helicase HFM1/MER3 [Dendrobium catenatum]|uniref:ATP-dependent DNA helicase HFM1/MER3 n=1 Tax=Dendrobium catenatum TaxID=906689 RepID=A0A2I0V7K3_9ASPA|nr:ATP-dependent DNA helicase HFM1/MER3 [Dendrobium catenatum]
MSTSCNCSYLMQQFQTPSNPNSCSFQTVQETAKRGSTQLSTVQNLCFTESLHAEPLTRLPQPPLHSDHASPNHLHCAQLSTPSHKKPSSSLSVHAKISILRFSGKAGGGKTVIFELYIVWHFSKFLLQEGKCDHEKGILKTIYFSPLKALAHEKLRIWNMKLAT